jgi:hypothetical protein
MRCGSLAFGLIVLLAASGCSSDWRTIRVAVPPRVDLAAYPLVGLVGFTANAKGELDRLGTEKFLQSVQSAQPGTRVIELGSEQQVLASVGGQGFDPATIRAIKEKHGVDALVLGRVDVERVRPDLSLSTFAKSFSVSQDVNVKLGVRLMETATGATMWSDGSELVTNVAHVGFSDRGEGTFSAKDPESAYGGMLDSLVWDVTDDFREHYTNQRVRKDDPAYASIAE